MIPVVFVADVTDPGHEGLLSQPVGNLCRVLRVTLAAHCERLEADQQLLGRRGAECASRVAKDLELAAYGKGPVGKALPELRLGVVELGEPICVTAPVKGATVDDDAAYRGAVAADPFGGRVNDDVYTVVDGRTEVSSTAKGVIALKSGDRIPSPLLLVHILHSESGFSLTINGTPLA